MAWTGVITNAGEALLQAMVGGASLVLTSVQTGSGNSADMYTATALNSPVTTGELSSQVEEGGVRVRVKVYPYTTNYTMKEIGIYGKVGSNSPVLFALMQDTTGVSIPDEETFPDFVYNMSTFVAMSNTDNFSVTVNPNANVSEEEFEQAVGTLVQLSRNFYTSTSSVSCPLTANKAYMVYCSSSSASGIMDSVNGALIFVANGKYAIIHKGTSITATVSGTNLVVSSSSSIPMAVIEI